MKDPFQKQTNLNLIIPEWQEQMPGLQVGFTTRGSINESFDLSLNTPDEKNKNLNNRQLLANHISFPLAHWVAGEQIHDTVIHSITKEDRGKGASDHATSITGIDGLITNEKNILCTAVFADCVPIFFMDPVTGLIGLAHAGWKGTISRIAQKMIKTMQEKGAEPVNIRVAIGPCISYDVYEVDKRVVQHIPDDLYEKTVKTLGNQRYLLDLKQLNIEILLQQDVLRHNIDITNYCTFRDESLFFSHRRDNGKTGRMIGYIGYKE